MHYVRNAWYVVAWSNDLLAKCPLGVRVLDEPIVIWRNAAGELIAFEDRCVHRLVPLSMGRCEAGGLRCIYHGLLYDGSGRVVDIPGQEKIPEAARVRVYPVVERHGWIWVWMGSASKADQNHIPAIFGLDHPDYVVGHGQLDFDAEARFVSANLLDLSHTSFLHTETFGVSEVWARERPKVTEIDRGVRSERWIRNEGAMGMVNTANAVDTYFCYDFFVPGVLMMSQRTYPVGSASARQDERPDLDRESESFTSQAVTPLTDKTTRYFYIIGAHRRQGGDPQRGVNLAISHKAFAEDKAIIEAQQRSIERLSGWKFMPTTADTGIIAFERLVERLIRDENLNTASAPQSTNTRR